MAVIIKVIPGTVLCFQKKFTTFILNEFIKNTSRRYKRGPIPGEQVFFALFPVYKNIISNFFITKPEAEKPPVPVAAIVLMLQAVVRKTDIQRYFATGRNEKVGSLVKQVSRVSIDL